MNGIRWEALKNALAPTVCTVVISRQVDVLQKSTINLLDILNYLLAVIRNLLYESLFFSESSLKL